MPTMDAVYGFSKNLWDESVNPNSAYDPKTQVSVIMAVHGSPTWLSAALESVLLQTFDSWEFLCLLDGPNGDAEKILKSFGTRFKYEVSPANIGASEARNRAMRMAVGEFVAVLDSDDIWPQDHLEKHVAAMTSDCELVLRGTSAEVIDESGTVTGELRQVPDENLQRRLLLRNAFVHSSTIYRRLSALAVGGYDPLIRVVEDLHLWLRLARVGKIENDSKRAIGYRVHASQISKQKIDRYSISQISHERALLANSIGVGRVEAWASDAAWKVYQRLP